MEEAVRERQGLATVCRSDKKGVRLFCYCSFGSLTSLFFFPLDSFQSVPITGTITFFRIIIN